MSDVDVLPQNACYVGIDMNNENAFKSFLVMDVRAAPGTATYRQPSDGETIYAGTQVFLYTDTPGVVVDPVHWTTSGNRPIVSIQVSGFAPIQREITKHQNNGAKRVGAQPQTIESFSVDPACEFNLRQII
tara:strand:+ start:28 stop:420 length:393 start_codon:yes stop_codon:yes gene_type:complete